MAKVKIQGHASGTGILTVTAPNTSTDSTITLPDSTGTLATTADVPSSITDNGNATAITIDSSENVLVGQTTSNFDAKGIRMRGDVGQITATRDGAAPLALNRLTSDGSVLDFNKAGNGVGSIGSEGGDSLYIQGGTTSGSGLHFHPSTAAIAPLRNGARIDATLDLGSSSNRFKDLYLEGGAYIGGTDSANKLGDYETGTWTPTNAGGWASLDLDCVGKYTKIGNMVHVVAFINVNGSGIGSGDITMGGLPFTSSGNSDYRPAISVFAYKLYSNVNNYISGLINSGGTLIYIREGGGTGDGADMGNHFDGGSSIYFQATYTTG